VLHVIAILLAAAPGFEGPVERTVSPRAVGAAVAEFRLNDIHRRPRSFGGFKDKKAFVVAFVDTECPVSNLYIPTLIELHGRYNDKGVQFLAINSTSQDSFITVSAHFQCSRTSTRMWPTHLVRRGRPRCFCWMPIG
jgi:thiol-disulfide isomerase/thioredoxin